MNGEIEKKEKKKAFLQSYQALNVSIKTLEQLLTRLKEEQDQSLSVLSGDNETDQGELRMTRYSLVLESSCGKRIKYAKES